MDYYSCLTCVPSLKIQALFSAKQERASGIYPASGITPTYLTLCDYFLNSLSQKNLGGGGGKLECLGGKLSPSPPIDETLPCTLSMRENFSTYTLTIATIIN